MSPSQAVTVYRSAVKTMAAKNSWELKWEYILESIKREGLSPDDAQASAITLLQDNPETLQWDEVEALMSLARHGLGSPTAIGALNKLICLPNHQCHEDIAMLLQQHRSPSSVPSLITAASANFGYMAWDENKALARKCMFALAAISNDESWEAISRFSNDDDVAVREWAEEQLRGRR